ncbi:V-set domain containing T-cell activation inhibitor 1 B7 -like protein 4 [Channa argus]|uniref:V-set domain containing T-cell activation inhibitor 1 B7-like protein 4 n=1 Tax=Channa argus TaxID=215402 RepID=A0A6G1Q707_CHAAH|nr:V-set domain containing T-cell activation inhibitor 1 B7 -like protein 4 [Channa argus]KAK2899384.1 hypothetical protein Q8A73_012513 [Channa argus]
MASLTPGISAALFTFLWIFVLTEKDYQQITVKTGDDVTLQCLDPRGGDIELLEWRRQDLKEDIFVCRHGKNDCSTSHPSFKNRVELRDPEMKDRNVSVILKNITINDTGTYECRVRNSNTEPPPQLISTINLTVVNSGPKVRRSEGGGDKDPGNNDEDHRGHSGLVKVLLVSNMLLVGVIFIIFIKRKWCLREASEVPPPDEEADQEPR